MEQPTPEPMEEVDPREEARKVVEAEKVKVLKHQELLLERREQEEIRYDPELDYSFLHVCKNGTKNLTNLTKTESILITHPFQVRGSAILIILVIGRSRLTISF